MTSFYQSSFGFGQVGGTAMVIHPRYLLAALEPSAYAAYKGRNVLRGRQSYKAMSDMMIKNSLVKIKEHPPYIGDMEGKVLLNSMARATYDPKTGEYSFKGKLPVAAPVDISNVKTVSQILSSSDLTDGSIVGVGVDQGVFEFTMPLSIFLIVNRTYFVGSFSQRQLPKSQFHRRRNRILPVSTITRFFFRCALGWKRGCIQIPWRQVKGSSRSHERDRDSQR